MGLGGTLGTLAGAVIGGIPTLGLGTGVGAAIGGALGSGIEGIAGQSKANKMQLSLSDPLQTEFLSDIKRKQHALETGAAYQAQQDVIKQAGFGTMENIRKVTGGDVGATVAALTGAQRATGKSLNELYATMGAEGLKLSTLMEDVVSKISKRKLEIQSYQKAQQLTQAAQAQKDAMAAIGGLTARGLGEGDWMSKLFPQTTAPQTSAFTLPQQLGMLNPMIPNALGMGVQQPGLTADISSIYNQPNPYLTAPE